MRDSHESGPAVEESDCRVWGWVVSYSAYMTDLHRESLKKRKLTAENPDRRAGKPCVYVGQTALATEERFAQHLDGRRSSRIVREFGVRLRPKLYAA